MKSKKHFLLKILVATSGLQQAVMHFVAVVGYLLVPEAAQNSVAVMLFDVGAQNFGGTTVAYGTLDT